MPENIGERLVYKERMQNIRDAVETFKDRSFEEGLLGLLSGFGHNNRKLVLGRNEAMGTGKFSPEGTY